MNVLSEPAVWAGILSIGLSLAVRRIRDWQREAATPRGRAGEAGYIYAVRADGLDFRFSIERGGPGWRAYVLSHPDYGERSQDFHTTHRVRDGARSYVCWDRPVPGPAQAEAVASLWAEKTANYIRCGTKF